MTPETKQMRESWIREGEIVLGSGSGHLGIINMLRSYGMDHVAAKKASYDIFDQAKLRLMKSLRLQKVIAWLMIIGGILLPIITFLSGAGFYIFSLTPIGLGAVWLQKLPNPSRLPENNLD